MKKLISNGLMLMLLCSHRLYWSRYFGVLLDFYSDNLFAPGTASALAFKHADCLAGEWVEYATDDVELGVALRAPSACSGHFSCEFFATEEIHFTPLHEQRQ